MVLFNGVDALLALTTIQEVRANSCMCRAPANRC